MEDITIDDLYLGIEEAETGNLNPGMARYIRTKKIGSGSSAFGPVQMTKAILSGPGYSDMKFTDEEDSFVKNVLIPQADNFLKYGGDDMIEGMERYDYGGPGDFTPADTSMYKQVAKKVMAYEFGPMRAKGDVDTFIQNWRGESEEEDPRYYKAVRSKLGIDNKAFNAMQETTKTPTLDAIKNMLEE
tara:strand:+ start:800 stop:1360 length:561 start_codon:yes stop_codon:yes gene_type:complete